MACDRQEISIIRGDTKTLRLTITDDNDDPIDLTGSTVHFRVKQKTTDADPALISKSSANAAEIEIVLPQATAGNTGRALIKLLPSDTALLAPGTYVYDAWVVLSSGAEHVVVKPSALYIERAVTAL